MTPDDFADLIVTTIKKALEGPLVAGRFDALENKMAAPSLKFQGIYAIPARMSLVPASLGKAVYGSAQPRPRTHSITSAGSSPSGRAMRDERMDREGAELRGVARPP